MFMLLLCCIFAFQSFNKAMESVIRTPSQPVSQVEGLKAELSDLLQRAEVRLLEEQKKALFYYLSAQIEQKKTDMQVWEGWPEIHEEYAQEKRTLEKQRDALAYELRHEFEPEVLTLGDCTICMELLHKEVSHVCKCGETICLPCIRDTARMHSHQPSKIRCAKCNRPFRVERALDIYSLQDLIESFRKEVTAASPDGKFCPTPDCTYHYIDEQPKSLSLKTECPRCKKTYCCHCLVNHEPAMTCQEATKMQTAEDDSRAWMIANTQPCPRCKTPVQKVDGCNHLHCSCGADFRWERRDISEASLPDDAGGVQPHMPEDMLHRFLDALRFGRVIAVTVIRVDRDSEEDSEENVEEGQGSKRLREEEEEASESDEEVNPAKRPRR